MRRTATWPQIELYGPGYTQIWGALYDRFGLDMAPTLDLSQPDEYWQRYMYFNAGWFFHRSPASSGSATSITRAASAMTGPRRWSAKS